ncbi:sensor histidine kinase [Clostridium tagluense]|uniref:sensor histidine kinase n=1 Tax=Clostridium tagluense TaxID=360422 RepID=UPI002162EF8D|nr:histidine kinase [Clostridium tagluense]
MKKLENTNSKLSEANLELEQMVKIKERNRIATEVHDTIGHTLTIVLMEIEAAKIYIIKDSKEAIKKLELAQEQARKGLNQIIRSIKDIKNDREEVNFELNLLKFIDEIENYSNITVITNITITEIISNEIGDALLKSIREGVTNGIRHGVATQFNLCVSTTNNSINLTMIDNGKGCSEIKQDFGLTAICQRIEDLKGMVEFASIEGENFSIEIKIPI